MLQYLPKFFSVCCTFAPLLFLQSLAWTVLRICCWTKRSCGSLQGQDWDHVWWRRDRQQAACSMTRAIRVLPNIKSSDWTVDLYLVTFNYSCNQLWEGYGSLKLTALLSYHNVSCHPHSTGVRWPGKIREKPSKTYWNPWAAFSCRGGGVGRVGNRQTFKFLSNPNYDSVISWFLICPQPWLDEGITYS